MKLTKLSLITALAMNVAFAGGDIAPVEPTTEVAAPSVSEDVSNNTTVDGKLTGYYITDDSSDEFFGKQSQLGLGVTLNVTHNFTDWLSANFSALGYVNALKTGAGDNTWGYFEQSRSGAYFNVANITAKFADTTAIIGRQLLDTPMLQGYDWLLNPGSFESATLVNQSIENVSLIGAYVTRVRHNNQGDFGSRLNGDNYALAAAYDDKTLNGSVWYYNVDALNYKQTYVDAGYNFGVVKADAQYVTTNNATGADPVAYGVKISGNIANIALSAAYNRLEKGDTAYIDWNSLYTNQWNLTVADQWNGKDLNAFKVAAATEFSGISAELSYADYDKGNETDLVLGYDFSKSIDAGLILSNTKANGAADAVNQFEIYTNYKF